MAGVRTTSPDYDTFLPKWQRVRDVIAGQDAMQKAAEKYLPKLKAENDRSYEARVGRSDHFNATWRTIDALVGMAFRKPPTRDVPSGIETYLDDIDLRGKSLEAFAKDTAEEVLSPGRVGILVDHPPQTLDDSGNVVPITVAVAQQRGLRPTLQLYTAESIRNWQFARIDNAWVLSKVVLGEKANIPDPKDEFVEKTEDRYRVLDLVNGSYRQRLFRIDDKGKDELLSEIYPLMNGKPMSFIPFLIVGPCGKGDEIDEPPLIDLVDKNVAHYQVNSDYRHGLHYCGLPTPFLAGVQNDDTKNPIYIGGDAAITSDFPDAKAMFLEFTGQGLEPMEKALDRLERQMAILGARMIADETQQVETLGATQIKRAGENSVLSKIVQAVSEAIETALEIFAEWAGLGQVEITYQINRDFLPAMMDGQTLLAIFAGVQSGNISKREAFELLQRGDVIDGEQSFEAHQEQVNSDPPPAPAKPQPPAQGEAA